MTDRMKQILDNLHKHNTDLIEMETSTFYAVAKIMEIPAIALLVVSDHSTCWQKRRTAKKYNHSRKVVLVDLIERLTKANL